MFAVGIEVSNGRSTVAVLQSKTKVPLKPFEVAHTAESLSRLAGMLNGLGDDVRIVMVWHLDCVARLRLNAFTERYRKWCSRHGYNFSEAKASQIYAHARQRIALVPRSDTAKLLVREAVAQLNVVSRTVEV